VVVYLFILPVNRKNAIPRNHPLQVNVMRCNYTFMLMFWNLTYNESEVALCGTSLSCIEHNSNSWPALLLF
jgi:hypothetical protein